MPIGPLRTRIENDPRLARIVHGSLSAIAGRGTAVLVNALLLPLILHYLGKLEFGIWITISTSVVMLSVLDLGIANTLTNFIAEAHSEDNRETAAQYFATAFWITSGVTVILAPLFYLIWRMVNWANVFHLNDPVQIRHAALCVAIAAGFFLLTLPLNLANKVLAGYQQVHLTNYFAMINSLSGLAAILITIALHQTIVQLMAAYCAAMISGTFALNLWLCLWQRPWIFPYPRLTNLLVVRRLFGQGILFFIIQCTGLVVFSTDNLIITHYLGPAAVTPYNFAWRFVGYATMLQAITLPSLWPAFTEAYHKGHLEWVRGTYRAATRKSLLAVGIMALTFALFGRFIIRIWAGPDAVPGQPLLWLMACFNMVMAGTTNQAFLLNATGRLRVEAVVAVLAAAFNLFLSIQLVQRIGTEGVILSTLLSFLIFMVVPQQIEVNRVLSGRYLGTSTAPGTGEVPAIAEVEIGSSVK